MSKTNPVMLNGVSVDAAGVELSDGDEVVFPSAESERIVFRYELVAKDTGAVLGVVKSIASPGSKDSGPKSPLGERNGEEMVSKGASPVAKPPKSAKKAKSPAKEPTPAKAATPVKEPIPTKAATPAKEPTPAKSPVKFPKSAKKSPAATPHTRASRALVANAVEALVLAENDAAAANEASPVPVAKSPAKNATPAKSPAKSPKSAKKSPAVTPHTRAARALVAEAVDSLVAEEAAEMEVDDVEKDVVEASPAPEFPTAKSPKSASKSPNSAKKSPRSAKKASASPSPAAVGFALSPIVVEEAASPSRRSQSAPSPMLSPRPSLKAPEARIGAQVPGSAARRRSVGIRFVSDAEMEQVRFIPPHNGEPEVCGRIAPNQHILSSAEKRRRTPNRRYSETISEAISEGVEEEEVDCANVNRIGCVGHTGPIPKFTAKMPVEETVGEDAEKKSPAKSPSRRSSSRKISLTSEPVSSGRSKRSAVSFAIGQAEVTDDVAGTPVGTKRSSSGFKRKGTPHAPPSRVEEDDEDEALDEEEEDEEEIMMAEEETMEEEDIVEGVDVTIVEEGIVGSGRTDGAPSSIAGTEMDERDVSGSALGGDTVDDIPVFRLGDVGNTGPIPHYSPACKASPMSTIKSAVKASPSVASPVASNATAASPAMTSGGRFVRSTRSRRSSQGVGGRAPANTPAVGADTCSAVAAAALMAGLEAYATIAQTPGGHAKHSAVTRILAMEAEEAEEPTTEASPAPTMLDVDVTREEIVTGATPFVERAEAAAAIEAAEAAAEAGAAAAQGLDEEEEAPVFDFDEAFAVDAQLAAEGVADVEAAVEIEHALQASHAQTPEKVEQWLEQNLAEAVEAEAEQAAQIANPQSLGPIDPISPATVIVKARGGSAGGRLHGGLSARVALIHRALRATRAALIREKQKSAQYKNMYLAAAKQATDASKAAAVAVAEVAAATSAAVAAAAEDKVQLVIAVKPVKVQTVTVVQTKTIFQSIPEATTEEVENKEPAKDEPAAKDDSEACKLCGCADERDALLCDGCDGAFHMSCLKPKLRKVPSGDWFCKECKPAPKRGRVAAAKSESPVPKRRSARARS